MSASQIVILATHELHLLRTDVDCSLRCNAEPSLGHFVSSTLQY